MFSGAERQALRIFTCGSREVDIADAEAGTGVSQAGTVWAGVDGEKVVGGRKDGSQCLLVWQAAALATIPWNL